MSTKKLHIKEIIKLGKGFVNYQFSLILTLIAS